MSRGVLEVMDATANECGLHDNDKLRKARATVERMAEALEQCAARLQIHIRHSEDLCAHMVACEALAAYRGEQA